MNIVEQVKKKMQAALDHLKEELKGIRTGRANPAVLDPVSVEVYGTHMRIRELATVSAPEARTLLISPFDSRNVHAIAKGIEKANLGLQPIVDGNVVRIKVPEMDASVRAEMVKIAKRKGEETKVSIRNVRRDGNEEAKKAKAEGKMTEDEQKKTEKLIQEQTDKSCKQADEIVHSKEQEILTI